MQTAAAAKAHPTSQKAAVDRPGRFLFVVPPLTGHTNPTIALGAELAARGHEVAWTGHPDEVGKLLPRGATFIPVADALPSSVVETYARLLFQQTRGAAAMPDIVEGVVFPLARHMLPGVRRAVDMFHPDVLIVDSLAWAGAAVAEQWGLPWATSATTSHELIEPLAAWPKIRARYRRAVTQLLLDWGFTAEQAETVDPRCSPHLILAFTTAELVGPLENLPSQCVFVGPSLERRPRDVPPDLGEWFDQSGPHVLVSLGTVNWLGGEQFFAAAAEALGERDVKAVLVAPPAVAPEPPANVLIRQNIPQLELMPRFDAVVTHGGHNTVCESLAFGKPLVVAPIRDDQPFVARQVQRAGAGIRISFRRVSSRSLGRALDSVLAAPEHRTAAEHIQASFQAAGGPPEAADRLEQLVISDPELAKTLTDR